jgi:hypothetical protein
MGERRVLARQFREEGLDVAAVCLQPRGGDAERGVPSPALDRGEPP